MTSLTPSTPVNFGWPCYEGAGRMSSYDAADLSVCENLYTDTAQPATGPYYTYNHGASNHGASVSPATAARRATAR